MKISSLLVLSGMALFVVSFNAEAATSVNVNVNASVPPPPGVHVSVGAERPVYREPARVVYPEREERHYKEKKRGHAYGHYKHDRGNGKHGKGKHGERD